MPGIDRVLNLLERYDNLVAKSIKCLDADHWQISLDELREEKEKLKQELLDCPSEKRKPKKVLLNRGHSQGRYIIGICPTCGCELGLLRFAKEYSRCSSCDQLLDWSNVTEVRLNEL